MKDEPHGNDIEHLRAKPADIVERLRDWLTIEVASVLERRLMNEAADEIERLRFATQAGLPMLAGIIEEKDAEIERLQAGLKSKITLHEIEIKRLNIAMGAQTDEIERLKEEIKDMRAAAVAIIQDLS